MMHWSIAGVGFLNAFKALPANSINQLVGKIALKKGRKKKAIKCRVSNTTTQTRILHLMYFQGIL